MGLTGSNCFFFFFQVYLQPISILGPFFIIVIITVTIVVLLCYPVGKKRCRSVASLLSCMYNKYSL